MRKELCIFCVLGAVFALVPQAVSAGERAASTREREAQLDSERLMVIRVGPARSLSRPSEAARIARDGDVVQIDAATYDGDVAVWMQNNLTIRAVGGRAHLRANGASAEGKAIWVLKGNNTTVEGIEVSGASVADRNGAGIRLEGSGLVLRRCYFHHNENGLLTRGSATGDVLIEHSEFAHNGFGDGYSHNIYIGRERSFTLRYSHVHHAVVGHNIKSRALENRILYNRIVDEHDGRSSYSIDLPDGGLAYVVGNIIQQSPQTENPAIVSYGAESLKNPTKELYFASNTVVNDLPGGGRFVIVREGTRVAQLVNNLFLGAGEMLQGPGELRNNLRVAPSDFVNADAFDYRLKRGSRAIGHGKEPGHARGFHLHPVAQYVHPMQKAPRRKGKNFDLGALEFTSR